MLRTLTKLVLLFLSLCLASPAFAATVKLVQSGTATRTNSGTTTVTITAIDTSKAFLIFQTRNNDNRPGGSMMRGRIASSTTLEFVSVRSETFNIQWYVVEFSSGVSVQRGSTTQSSTSKNVTLSSAVSSLNQAFVTWSKTPSSGDSSWSLDDPIVGQLTSTSNVQFRSEQSNSDHIIWWQVIEYTNVSDINVQTGSTASMQGNEDKVSQTITSVDTSKAFLLAGFTTSDSGSDIDERMIRGRFKSSTEIEFKREGKGDDIDEIFWQVIELKDGTVVQSGEDKISNNSSSKDVSISAVTVANSIAFASIQAVSGQNMGSTKYDGDDIPGDGSATFSFTDSTTLTIERNTDSDNNNDEAKFGWFVLDFTAAVDNSGGGGSSGTCDNIPVDYAAYGGSKIKIEDSPTNNGNSLISNTYSNSTLSVSATTPSSSSTYNLPATNPVTLPNNSSTTQTDVKNSDTLSITSADTFDKLKAKDDSIVTISGGGTFYIEELKGEDNATINIAAGTYYIDKFELKNSAILNITSGPVIFYIGDSFKMKNSSVVTGADSVDDFQINMVSGSDDVKFEDSANFTGMVYAPYGNKIEVKNSATVHAHLVTSGELKIKDSAVLTFSSSDIDDVKLAYNCNNLPLISLAMDEAAWDGTANEVLDDSGNNNHGTTHNSLTRSQTSPALTGTPGTCGYGVFDGVDDYIALPSIANLTDSFTVTAWIKSTQSSRGRIFADDDNNTSGFALSLNEPSNGYLRFYSRSVSPVILDTTSVVLPQDGSWYFVAAVHNASTKERSIYVNGSSVVSGTYTGTWGSDAGTFSIGSETNSSGEGVGFAAFQGNIDEFQIYESVLSESAIQTLMSETHVCTVSTIASFTITPASTIASTCLANAITITAIDSNGVTMTDYDGTINLSTTANHGDWVVNTATNSLTSSTSDDGAASYTFSTSDSGVIILELTNTHADTFTINAVDNVVAATSSNSSSITNSKNIFNITVNDSAIDASLTFTPIMGRDHVMKVEMWTDDTANSGSCGIATGYTGTKPLRNWGTRHTDDTLAGDLPFFNGAGTNMPTSEPISDNASLEFSSGVASFSIKGFDATKFDLNLKDTSRSFANNEDISGDSPTLTTRPFGLAITDITATSSGKVNPEANIVPTFSASTPDTNLFAAAGDNFSVKVSAVLWDAADDTESAGKGNGLIDSGREYRDNTLTNNNFAWDTSLVRLSSGFTPSSGSAGDLFQNGSSYDNAVAKADFTNGGSTESLLQYTEVGSFTIQASTTNFLNSSISLASDDVIVGRFSPAYFSVTANSDGTFNNVNSTFTYTGQNFTYNTAPSFTVTAYSALNTITTKYTGTYSNLTNSLSATANSSQAGTSTTLGLSYTQAADTYSDGADGTHSFIFGADTLNYTKSANSKINAFDNNTNILVASITDNEVTSAIAQTFTPTGLNSRYGRLNISNAHGSELIDLTIPFKVEYYNGTNFVDNIADSTTTFNSSDFNLAQNFSGSDSSQISSITGTLSSGASSFTLCTPGDPVCTAGTGNTGYIDLTLKSSASQYSFLKYDWDGDASDEGSNTARATFGIFNGNPKQIYIRELY